MWTEVSWIPLPHPGAIGIMPRPRGGDWLEDEISALAQSGVTVLVSLLERSEEEEFELLQERALADAAGLDYVSLPIPDRSVPADSEAAIGVIDRMARAVAGGSRVVVHCRQGIGRAALIACGALMRLGASAEEAISAVGEARGCEVPETDEQRRWLQGRARILQADKIG